jgi:hypothetical protein
LKLATFPVRYQLTPLEYNSRWSPAADPAVVAIDVFAVLASILTPAVTIHELIDPIMLADGDTMECEDDEAGL